MACPVYDMEDLAERSTTVHLVNDDQAASQSDAAYCGVLPGTTGWVIWQGGDVPESSRCAACFAKL